MNKMDIDYLLGLPSGQIIDIDYKDINNLKQEGLINYSQKHVCYIFDDNDYDNILFYLKRKTTRQIDLTEIIDFFRDQPFVKKYYPQRDGSVRVDGSIIIDGGNYKTFPFKFQNINGDFIFRNCELTTLEDGPTLVSGNFNVSDNLLTDLIGGPASVRRNYDCSGNLLATLKGSPAIIGGDFNCSDNNLTDFEGGPKQITGILDCTGNNFRKNIEFPSCFHMIMYGKPIKSFNK